MSQLKEMMRMEVEENDLVNPEHNLIIAIINNALIDALARQTTSKKREKLRRAAREREEAVNYLTREDSYINYWLRWCNVDPPYFRKLITEILRKNPVCSGLL